MKNTKRKARAPRVLTATRGRIYGRPLRQPLQVTWTQCDPKCAGWLHMHDPREIQRCDACARFQTDEEAQRAHQEECGCAWGGPITKEYRGWSIVPCEVTHLGYRLGEGAKSRPGKGRKLKGYLLTYAPDNREKFVPTLEGAREYVDSYMGPEEK